MDCGAPLFVTFASLADALGLGKRRLADLARVLKKKGVVSGSDLAKRDSQAFWQSMPQLKPQDVEFLQTVAKVMYACCLSHVLIRY